MAITAGKVESYLLKRIKEEGALLLGLLDPVEQTLKEAARKSRLAEEGGCDAILIGGSVGAIGSVVDETVRAVKDGGCKLPVILFPGNVGSVSKYADAIYFLTLVNSESSYWCGEAQMLAAPMIRQIGIESIPVAYVVIEPGGAVGWVGRVRPIPRDNPEIAAACALAGKYMGSHFILTDSGSGASSPAPKGIISAVKSAIGDVPYIYGGGIRTPEQAAEVIGAGADVIQIGAAFEHASDPKGYVQKIVKAIRAEAKKKR